MLTQDLQNLKSYNNDFKILLKDSLASLDKKGKIIFIGNGGSAAESQHFAAELVGKFLKSRRPIPSLALTTDTSIITSIGNDDDFKYIYSRQLEALCNKNDIVILLSTSGLSENILQSIKYLNLNRINYYLISSNINVLPKNIKKIIKLPGSRTDRNQEIHLIFLHSLCEAIEKIAR